MFRCLDLLTRLWACTFSIKTITSSIAKLTDGCQHIMNSAELRTMLQMCLQAGNYLNQGTFRGGAVAADVGFLSQVRATTNSLPTAVQHPR